MVTGIYVKVVDLSEHEHLPENQEEAEEETFRALLNDTVARCGVKEIVANPVIIASKKFGYMRFFQRTKSNEASNTKEENSIEQCSKVTETILRYVKLNDRWIQLTSLLMKSQLYHSSVINSNVICEGIFSKKPLILLPRTQAGKPYIPFDEKNKNSAPLFNISHQYPFVGLAYTNDPVYKDSEYSLSLGLDIVVFDAYKETMHLYSSLGDFLDVFRQSFTPWEWTCIQDASLEKDNARNNDKRIEEFFIRWAIKEAYTKALGAGMSTNFSSFETRLRGADETNTECEVFSATILKGHDFTCFRGEINFSGDKKELWNFIFKPLSKYNEGREEIFGCACICVGPIKRDSLSFDLNFLPTKLNSIISYHLPKATEVTGEE